MLAGISPDNLLCATLSCSNFFICPIDFGNGPTKLLKLTSKTVTFWNTPKLSLKQPVSPLFIRRICVNVLAILEMLEGTHPRNPLLARTRTDTGEFPRFWGKEDWNLLLLMNKASSFLSKSSVGISPWNSLKRISRNFREGKEKTTDGKFPENLLLLMSSSKRDRSSRKLEGRVPQKRLELMWKRPRSQRRPRSSGK